MPIDSDPFIGSDIRKADTSHRERGWLAYDTCNADAWKESATYLDTTGADAVFLQETKVAKGP